MNLNGSKNETINSFKTKDLMHEYSANVRGMPKKQTMNMDEMTNEHGRLSATMIYFEISKEDIEVIYSIKEAYLQLKDIIGCC